MSAVKQQRTPNRWKKGESGNPHGRPVRPEVEELRNALAQVGKEKGISFLVNYIRRSYQDGAMSIALLRKLVPDLIVADFDVQKEVTSDEIIKQILDTAKSK